MIGKNKKVRDFKRKVSYFNHKILLTKKLSDKRDRLRMVSEIRIELVNFLKLHEDDRALQAMDSHLYFKMRNSIRHLIYRSEEKT